MARNTENKESNLFWKIGMVTDVPTRKQKIICSQSGKRSRKNKKFRLSMSILMKSQVD